MDDEYIRDFLKKAEQEISRLLSNAIWSEDTATSAPEPKPLTCDDFINACRLASKKTAGAVAKVDPSILGERKIFYVTSPHVPKVNDKGELTFLLTKHDDAMYGLPSETWIMHDDNEDVFCRAIRQQGWAPVKIGPKPPETEGQEEEKPE